MIYAYTGRRATFLTLAQKHRSLLATLNHLKYMTSEEKKYQANFLTIHFYF